MTRILEEIVSSVFFETKGWIGYDSAKKINAFKRQHENNCEQSERRYTPKFPDPAVVEQGSDSEIFLKGRNSVF